MKPTRRPRSLAVILQASQKHLVLDLAAHARKVAGTETHVYCDSEETRRALQPHLDDGTLDSVNVMDRTPTAFPADLDEAAVLGRASANEARLGRTMSWFALVNRHFGRGFAPQGVYHPRSRASEDSTWLQYLDHSNRLIDYWDREIQEKGIDVIVNADFLQAAVARAHGVAVRTFISARLRNLYFWATDEYWASQPLIDAYGNATAGAAATIEAGPYGQGELAKVAATTTSFAVALRRAYRKLLRYLYLRLKGYPYNYYLGDELRLFFRQWWRVRRVIAPRAAGLEELRGRPFVFFPLQVEPERNFQGGSPEYFYQHAAIMSLARDLPAGVTLAVKEHFPAVARRSREFYRQLAELKNLRIVDAREPGVQVIREAAAVATINSTAGMEAAIMGKPVVTFGRHNIFDVMPHVMVVTDEAELKGCLERALSPEFDREQALKDGARFVAALESVSVDMAEFSYPNPRGYRPEGIERAFELLCASLDSPRSEPAYSADTERSNQMPGKAGTPE